MLEVAKLALRAQRGAFIGWSIAVFALAVMTASFYPFIQAEYDKIFESLPPEFVDAFVGEIDPSTPEGFITAEFLSYIPILFAIFATSMGAAALAGEEQDGTLDLLLAQPVHRWSLVVEKFAAGAALLLGLSLVAGLGLLVGAWVGGMDVAWWRLLLAGIDLWPLSIFVLGLAMLGSAIFHRRAQAVLLGAGYVTVAYFLNLFAPLAPELESLRYVSMFYYAQGSDALLGEPSGLYWALGCGLGLAGGGAAVAWFHRKDLRG